MVFTHGLATISEPSDDQLETDAVVTVSEIPPRVTVAVASSVALRVSAVGASYAYQAGLENVSLHGFRQVRPLSRTGD